MPRHVQPWTTYVLGPRRRHLIANECFSTCHTTLPIPPPLNLHNRQVDDCVVDNEEILIEGGQVDVLAIIKNGQEMWDQAKNPSTSPEKKLKPLYSAGEGRKRESGISMWNKEGLAFYYTVEKGFRDLQSIMSGSTKDKSASTSMIKIYQKWIDSMITENVYTYGCIQTCINTLKI